MEVSMRLPLLILIFGFSNTSLACSCAYRSEEEKFKIYDYIYIGRIVQSTLTADRSVTNKLEVLESIKGVPSELTLITELGDESSCSIVSVVGSTYKIYGIKGKTPVMLSGCSDNTPIVLDSSERPLEGLIERLNRARADAKSSINEAPSTADAP
jgi:hypothetical protein